MTRIDEGPLFVWDGECGFCRFWVSRWRARLGDAVRFAPFQDVGERFPDISDEAFRRSAKLVEEDGTVREAAAAVFRLLSLGPGTGIVWWLHRRVPPFRWAAEAAYRWIADHRELAARVTRLLWGRDPTPPTFATAARLVTRVVALVYLVAFVSLAVQVRGLIGPDGILPAGEYLDAVSRATGGGIAAVLRAPTLAWLAPGGGALVALCAVGSAAALALFFEIVPLAGAAAAWVLYLSLRTVGQAFLSFQWDLLLLEAGFLLLFLVPAGGSFPAVGRLLPPVGRLLPAGTRRERGRRMRGGPWFPAVWLFWWLLFRLIFESGLVKLTGGDPVWRDLTALAHHYETQPIPNPLAWYAHQLPEGIHRLSTLVTLGVELGVPFLFFLPRRPRMLGGVLVIGHQAAILLTGNYTFFNLLTIAV
ncbi:MAG TPA: lipase maturation factor family protein, partial [Longimicrobiales bacterium]|nr:lipase maturation factor family protein [Longimicrobiales bacterium]